MLVPLMHCTMFIAIALCKGLPISTIRFEQVREGIEDYEYFRLLHDLVARIGRDQIITQKAQALLRLVDGLVGHEYLYPGMKWFNELKHEPDITRFFDIRRQIAQEIVRLEHALKTFEGESKCSRKL